MHFKTFMEAMSNQRMKTCDWCRQNHSSGEWRNGDWVCYGCFPERFGEREDKEGRPNKKKKKVVQEVMTHKCCYCGGSSTEGGWTGNLWVCAVCDPSMKQTKKKNKYAQYSKVDHNEWYDQSPRKNKGKERHKKGKNGLVQIEYWKVVIEEISCGSKI
jgi:hypothetical protein